MSSFILSCTTCAVRGVERDEILACFKYAPKAGYAYWGIAGPPLWDLGGARWFNTRLANQLAAEAGLKGCTEVYGPQFPTESPEAAEAAAADIALMCQVAEEMASPLVVITGGKKQPRGGLEASIAGIKKLLTMIGRYRVRLALEPHYNSQFMTREDFDALMEQVDDPKVGITVDAGHFHSAGVDWVDLIRTYPKRVYNIHLKDHIGRQSVPIGKGEINLRALIEVLHEIDYQGALAVELEVVDPENLPRYITESYQYMKRMITEVTGQPPEA